MIWGNRVFYLVSTIQEARSLSNLNALKGEWSKNVGYKTNLFFPHDDLKILIQLWNINAGILARILEEKNIHFSQKSRKYRQ